MKRTLTLLALSAISLFAQNPTVTGFFNNYGGNIPIAQGSILAITGSNLSTATTALQNAPLQTTLQGVRIRFSVNTVVTYAPIYYVTPGQVAVIVPSATPTGTGNVVIERNGLASAPFAITIVRSSFGTLYTAGTSNARVHDSQYRELSASNATNPGQYLIFYGSGVGPTTKDETVAQTGANASGDMTSIPTVVTIGGKTANVLYRGRTEFPGLDQINVQVPTLDSYSCSVAVNITTNGVAGNATTIPVAASGSTCTNPNPGGGGGATAQPTLTQSEIDAIVSRGAYKAGFLSLDRSTVTSAGIGPVPGTTTKTDSASGFFYSISGLDLRNNLQGTSSIAGYVTPADGVCNVLNMNSSQTPSPYPNLQFAYLDAGASLTLSGPIGQRTLTKSTLSAGGVNFITYDLELTGGTLTSGNYTFTGPGGSQVGSFSVNIPLAAEIQWTNMAALATVTRANGMNVTWSGGDPGTLIVITGTSFTTSGASVTGATFTCYANQSRGSFTVPASVLNQLPASSEIAPGFSFPGSVSLMSQGNYTRGSASGLDFLWVSSTSTVGAPVTFR